jgi:arylsulfatase A
MIFFQWLEKTAVLFFICFSATAETQPNVVLIVADDLGYGDLSCYGGEGRIQTPNCDRLAEEGMRFTQAYTAASVCTPARYSLLTGRYPWRTWLKKGVVGNTPALIEPDDFTMADLFKSAGYKTAAIGKWHIGFGDRGQKDLDWNAEIPGGPRELGFDTFFGMPVSHFYPPFVYIENRHVYNLDPDDPLWLEWPDGGGMPTQHGGAAATYKQENAGRELIDRVCDFIVQHCQSNFPNPNSPTSEEKGRIMNSRTISHNTADSHDSAVHDSANHPETRNSQPFFLYYAAIEPHTPFTPHPDYVGTSDAGLYGDFVVQFDDGIGRIFQTLEKQGIADNTIVILTSDNGGISTGNGHFVNAGIEYNPNVPLRGDKGDALEGGLRIPFIIRWPGVVKPGTVSDEIICQTDLLAAFANLLNEPVPHGAAEDSRNILAALKGGTAPDTPIVLQSRAGFHALRQGGWIFLDVSHEGDFGSDGDVGTPGQLYNLAEDLHQDDNFYSQYPERVQAMLSKLEAIRNPPPAAGDGSTLSIRPDVPEGQHLDWNDALWGDPAAAPLAGNHYIFDRSGIWLHGLGKTYGGFNGESLTLKPGASLFVSGGGPLDWTLILDGGQLQNRINGTSVITGSMRVDSASKVLMVAGDMELQTGLSGAGELRIAAHQDGGRTFVFNGDGAAYSGTFILADSGADGAALRVEFRKNCPSASLAFETAAAGRRAVLVLKGALIFQNVRLPAQGGGTVELSPGTYDAAALNTAGVVPDCFEDGGGTMTVVP